MARASQLKKIGPLEVIEVPGSPTGPVIVLFHGYGANAYDLLSLVNLVSTPPGTAWFFVQGDLKVVDGGFEGRAWFPLDVQALDRAMMENRFLDFSNLSPQGLKQIREKVLEMLNTLKMSSSRLVLMGFSQGAMLATDLALRLPEKIAGLVILSGNLINKDLWREKAKTKVGLHFFQSHGDQDQLLDIKQAENLNELLTTAGLKGQYHPFHGGHEIPQEIIYKLGVFLKKIFTPQN